MTLIEVLTVVAILGILAAIVLPVLARAKLSSDKAATISNLRQIVSAQLMYAADFGELALDCRSRPNPWPVQLQPYIGTVPDAPHRASENPLVHEPGYAVNQCLSIGINQVDDPSKTVMLTEIAVFREPNGGFTALGLPAPDEIMQRNWRRLGYPGLYAVGPLRSTYYSGQGPYGLLDGSVRFASPNAVQRNDLIDCRRAPAGLRIRFPVRSATGE